MIDTTYNHLDAGHPDNRKAYRICGAHKTDGSGELCAHHAGYGTHHPGSGRCKFHGGSSLGGPGHGRWTKGRYAKSYTSRMASFLRDVVEDERDPLDLLPELDVSRALVSMWLSVAELKLGEGESVDSSPLKNVLERELSPEQVHDGGDTSNDFIELHGTPPQPEFSSFSPGSLSSSSPDDGGSAGLLPGVGDIAIVGDELEFSGKLVVLPEHMRPTLKALKKMAKKSSMKDILDNIQYNIDKVAGVVERIQRMRSDSALGKAELIYLRGGIERVFEKYIPERGIREAAYKELGKLFGGR